MFPGWPCGLRSDSCSSPSPPKNGNNCWSLHRQSAIVRLENIQASQFLLRSEFKDKPSCLLFTFAFMDAQGCMSIIRGKLKRKSGKGDDRTFLLSVCLCKNTPTFMSGAVKWVHPLCTNGPKGRWLCFFTIFPHCFFCSFYGNPTNPAQVKE